jgi:hypothetical protein
LLAALRLQGVDPLHYLLAELPNVLAGLFGFVGAHPPLGRSQPIGQPHLPAAQLRQALPECRHLERLVQVGVEEALLLPRQIGQLSPQVLHLGAHLHLPDAEVQPVGLESLLQHVGLT